jgi:hypothetical protein
VGPRAGLAARLKPKPIQLNFVEKYETRNTSEFHVGPFRHAVRICESHIILTLNFLHKVSHIKKKPYLKTTNNPGANTVHVSVTCTILILHLHSKEVLGIYAMQQPDVQLVHLDQTEEK